MTLLFPGRANQLVAEWPSTFSADLSPRYVHMHILSTCTVLLMKTHHQTQALNQSAILYWSKATLPMNGLVSLRTCESARKTKRLWENVFILWRHCACCSATILTLLWILRGVKVKNYHQISHWFQLVLPFAKPPLSVGDHWLVLILTLVLLLLIATGLLSVLQPNYQSASSSVLHGLHHTQLHSVPLGGTFTQSEAANHRRPCSLINWLLHPITLRTHLKRIAVDLPNYYFFTSGCWVSCFQPSTCSVESIKNSV